MVMATPAQIAANRLNAQKSTGPRTEKGKAATRFNSLQHGLAAESLVLPHENPDDFEMLRSELLVSNQPANLQERMMVDQLAQSYWRMLRATSAETGILNNGMRSLKTKMALPTIPVGREDEGVAVYLCAEDGCNLDRFLRYHASVERSYHRAIEALRKAQNDRFRRDRSIKIGSAPQADAHAKSGGEKLQVATANRSEVAFPNQALHQSSDLLSGFLMELPARGSSKPGMNTAHPPVPAQKERRGPRI